MCVYSMYVFTIIVSVLQKQSFPKKLIYFDVDVINFLLRKSQIHVN